MGGGVICKEDLEVQGQGPLSRVGLDVETRVGLVDLGDDYLDGEFCILGGFLVTTNSACRSFQCA